MWKAPVNTHEALPYIVDAARRDGYLGLMVILARTAEARSLHEELSRDWTSIHDVTGHRIAVLCPDPYFVDDPEETPYYAGVDDRIARFWNNLTLDDCVDFTHTNVLTPHNVWGGVPVARPPYPKDVQHAAWTEAVSRCAAFFGIAEMRLPAVLVLCLRERGDVLIQLRPETSLYKLCKKIASHPGYSPEDAIQLQEWARLTDLVERFPRRRREGYEWRKADDSPRSMARLLDVEAVRKQIDGLRHHMAQVVHVDPNAHRAWSQSLEELIRTDAAEETAQARLSEIVCEVREHPRKVDWRRLDHKVRKVQLALRKAADPPEKFHYVPESQEEKTEREAELAALQAELAQRERWLDSRPGLAEACRQAALDEIGPCAVESLELSEYIGLRRGYSAERIQAIRPTGPAPASKDAGRHVGAGITARTDNDLSGVVHGPAVQAGRMGDVHVHVHGRRRPPGTEQVTWLQRLWTWRRRRD
ncbi:hypothetical protein QFZ22_000954 [Streptomyces canus]|uniref:Uncharacterized protein n=1 Tax=Streptomyces canus TaxID=58343 RepID=A0AAW8F498_9ACTN|nr:hypothetical protein [Streptomyces canus]MDQ0904969.1 hypothetical protein [Streptomyces canus]